ncbi:rho GTPase-activating protein 23 isoform X3 [Pelodiscus sinensis]|uniref:rho GTPase-activating protein 23 isoform X3 n=1 Tax=Pelodiscus sinensis TaxID=13735 RepID=UPI003F6ABA70
MVEEGVGGGGPRRPLAGPKSVSAVGKALWSVQRAGKGWRAERPIGVDCSSPEPRCIWLSSLRQDPAGLELWGSQAGAAHPRRKCHARPRMETRRMPTLGRRDGTSPNANAPPEEPFPWVGPKTVLLQKGSQGGFGFTLRHFIVYPPESAVHSNVKEEENGNQAGPQRGRLEPMDTIFVKNVKEEGPAHQAGLRTGDRLVKVNGESIIGKTYSQVIALIQNSDDALELAIMPKDEDILQLAYSQDAYLKGNEPYSGGAQSIPEPPPICYPRKTYPFQARAPSREATVAEPVQAQPADGRSSRPAPSGPASPLTSAWLAGPTPSAWNKATREFGSARSSPARCPPQLYYGTPQPRPEGPVASSPSRVSPGSCPPPLAASLPERYGTPTASSASSPACYGRPLPDLWPPCGYTEAGAGPGGLGRPSWECAGGPRAVGRRECQQALSNWLARQEPRRSSSEERRYAMPPRYRSASQDRLGDSPAARGWPHSASQDTLLQPSHAAWGCRARSDNYLGRCGRSTEALAPGALAGACLDKGAWLPEKPPRQAARTAPSQPGSRPPAAPARVQKHPSQPDLRSMDDSGYVGYRSYSPSFQRRTGLLHARSFRDPGFGGLLAFSLAPRPGPPPAPHPDRPTPPAAAPPPPPGSGAPPDQRAPRHEGSARLPPPEAEERKGEVVLRQKPPTGRKAPAPARQMNFVFPEEPKETELCDPPSGKGEAAERPAQRVAPLAVPEDSLASIPFIDEPTSPSIDLKAKHVPASSVVSSAMNSAPVMATSPSSPPFSFTASRHYSQDCSSIKAGRRSSYLLAITTERSKSCDDGLNTFRDEGKLLRRIPSRVPSLRMLRSFFTDGSLDSLGTAEDSRSKRHSTSDLSDVTFSDVRKEGWLHYKQILTKKGKAEDRDDMLAWIKVIRENSKAEGEDPGFASQALINKKLNDYRKVSPSGTKPDCSPKGSRGLGIRAEFLKPTGTRQDVAMTKDEGGPQKVPWGINIMKKNKKAAPRAFGVRLEDCQPAPGNKNVPLLVETCCRVVEDKGLEYMGIYRVPGNNAVVSSLQEQLNKAGAEINLQDERWQDLNVISSLLKSFFRKLPEPLFTDDKYNDFIEANRIEDASERMKTLRKLIRDLPGQYYETLKFLVGHLKTIADHSEKNKMEPRNLALVFGPTLVRTSEDNMTDMVTHMPDRYKIVETLIQHSDWFFSDQEDKEEKTPVDEKEAQSVPNIEYLLPNIGRTAGPGDASDSTNSSSAKSKGSGVPRKDQYAKELLAISFISAVNRKRKKRREAKLLGSSTDDDSEHEAPLGAGRGRAEEAGGGGPVEKLTPEPGPMRNAPSCQTAVEGPGGLLVPGPAETEGPREPAPDARSIVSGYSTLSTIDRSLCSEVQSVAESRGEEADDERSELSHVETDTESSCLPRRAGLGAGQRPELESGDREKLARDSFSSRRLIQCDTLARRKLARPRAGSEASAQGSQESLQAPEEPRGGGAPARPSLTEQIRLRLRGSADDMAVRMRQPHSPETRRKKSSWRRHTVVVPGGLRDLASSEWAEPRAPPGGLESCPPATSASCRDLRRDKDSGLSSLESTKARPCASSALSHQGSTGERPHPQGPGGDPGDRSPAPPRTASFRFHQCL